MRKSEKSPGSEIAETKLHTSAQQMVRSVTSRQRRMLQARSRHDRELVRSLALLGVVGWSVTVPTLAGVALGIWLDRIWQSRISWTLTLLVVGLGIGCWNAWSNIKEHTKG